MINFKRLVFLDIDGVLNSENYYLWRSKNYKPDWPSWKDHIDENAVKTLNSLKGCEIVISSSWGYNFKTVNTLKRAGLELPIIGGIKHDYFGKCWVCRGNYIALWFEENDYDVPHDYCFNDDGWYKMKSTKEKTLPDGSTELITDETYLSYVIIDDDDDMLLQQKNHFIHVNRWHGLTDDDIEKAKEILNICES